MKIEPAKTFTTDEERWLAVARRDKRADGAFFYSVETTGVYCRPSCASRLARRENVRFHATAAAAEEAGFRPCKRCNPQGPDADARNARIIAEACNRIAESDVAPDLNALAAAANLSPSHFHRLFKSVTGVTPKAYAAAHRTQRVRTALPRAATVTSAIYAGGFNSNGRFYADSAAMLGMTPSAFRAGGEGESIRFAVGACSLGAILVAATEHGVCAITLGDRAEELERELRKQFSKAEIVAGDRAFAEVVAKVVAFVEQPGVGLDLPLDVRGTAFQHRVWQALRAIPPGATRSYTEVAEALGAPKAVRAVARACATNTIAVAIPCHRVVRSDGSLSGYRWGIERKEKLLENERKTK